MREKINPIDRINFIIKNIGEEECIKSLQVSKKTLEFIFKSNIISKATLLRISKEYWRIKKDMERAMPIDPELSDRNVSPKDKFYSNYVRVTEDYL